MAITLDPQLESRLLERANAEGVSVSVYVERLVSADEEAEDELESLALEGLRSGEPLLVGTGYWEEKHRRLEDRLKRTSAR